MNDNLGKCTILLCKLLLVEHIETDQDMLMSAECFKIGVLNMLNLKQFRVVIDTHRYQGSTQVYTCSKYC